MRLERVGVVGVPEDRLAMLRTGSRRESVRACRPEETAERVIRFLELHSRRARLQAVPRRITEPGTPNVLWVGLPAA